MSESKDEIQQPSPYDIAVIAQNCRFPGANNAEEFWNNLRDGIESVSFFSPADLAAAGVDATVRESPGFVGAGSVLEDVDLFDATFFGFSARDAELMDPQQRLFIEVCWETMEQAGYDSDRYPGMVGVFAGTEMSTYIYNIFSSTSEYIDPMTIGIGNDKDHLTTHVSYKLNLKGPSVCVQTACSTSLVAIAMACQSLISCQSDMVLAGGATVVVPQRKGYFYQPGGINSPDGHCRPFDAAAQGTVGGSGIGVVLLKRLADAIREGDQILAVIRGWGINNDGGDKIGYTAPSIAGQAEVIQLAHAVANFNPETITCVEAHGTATLLGDPIEFAALSQAFAARTSKKGFCALGSVKSNFGHLASAAGIAGFIKIVQALRNKQIPPSLHYAEPNPQIDFPNSPFYLNAELRDWESNGPRRAAISSFGIGGTNAHVILEEAPEVESSGPSRSVQMFVFSAKNPVALSSAVDRLADHIESSPDVNLADVAYTLHVGRRAFQHRSVLVSEGGDPARVADSLRQRDPAHFFTGNVEGAERPVLFLFPGQGTQYAGMARGLYDSEPTFRQQFDSCCELLSRSLNEDLRELIYPRSEHREAAGAKLKQTLFTQPALFALEYSLACLWMEWGIVPEAMIGHSIGEYVAACLAGVMSLENAAHLVVKRAQLMNEMPPGAMLAVPLSETDVQPLLNAQLNVAAVNSPDLTVLSGPIDAIEHLERQLATTKINCQRLHTSHAFHSAMMEPAVWPLVREAERVRLNVPQMSYISNVTGTWMTPENAMNPSYYGRHLRQPVRFLDGIREVFRSGDWIGIEVGPGQTLSGLCRRMDSGANRLLLPSLRGPQGGGNDVALMQESLAQLWLAGIKPDWDSFYQHEIRRRVSLPTYPFERQSYWIGPSERPISEIQEAGAARERDISEWFYVPSWRQESSSGTAIKDRLENEVWAVFDDGGPLAQRLSETLERAGAGVLRVRQGQAYRQVSANEYEISPGARPDYDRLVSDWKQSKRAPHAIAHLWTVPSAAEQASFADFERLQLTGFYSVLYVAQSLHKHNIGSVRFGVISTQLHAILGNESLAPPKATVLSACRAIPQEFTGCVTRNIEVNLAEAASDESLAQMIVTEFSVQPAAATVAYRKGRRWVQTYDPVRYDKPQSATGRLRDKGVYLITGGLGNIGLLLAEVLAEKVQARLVLIGRSGFPDRSQWQQIAENPADPNQQRAITLLRLESMGAEVMVIRADASKADDLRTVFDQAARRFGAIHGIIHGAGNVSGDGFVSVDQTNRAAGDAQFVPKVRSLYALDELIHGKDLDFVLMLSSLSAVLGGLNLTAYAAANQFLDAYSNQQNQAERNLWISVDWDAWYFPAPGEPMTDASSSMIWPQDGKDAFLRILDRAPRQVVVSTTNLKERLDKWINMNTVRDASAAASHSSANLHPRPNLSTKMVAPRNSTEETIAGVWQSMLGVAPVGVHDKFFELGGHSLLAIQLISRLREIFELEIPVQRLFESPTIAGLAEGIEQDKAAIQQTEQTQDEQLAEILDMVSTLSEDEVQELLNAEAGKDNEAAHGQ